MDPMTYFRGLESWKNKLSVLTPGFNFSIVVSDFSTIFADILDNYSQPEFKA